MRPPQGDDEHQEESTRDAGALGGMPDPAPRALTPSLAAAVEAVRRQTQTGGSSGLAAVRRRTQAAASPGLAAAFEAARKQTQVTASPALLRAISVIREAAGAEQPSVAGNVELLKERVQAGLSDNLAHTLAVLEQSKTRDPAAENETDVDLLAIVHGDLAPEADRLLHDATTLTESERVAVRPVVQLAVTVIVCAEVFGLRLNADEIAALIFSVLEQFTPMPVGVATWVLTGKIFDALYPPVSLESSNDR
ncbi:MAG: hypothetical protein ACRC0L_11700 [Angustibacter sp.]